MYTMNEHIPIIGNQYKKLIFGLFVCLDLPKYTIFTIKAKDTTKNDINILAIIFTGYSNNSLLKPQMITIINKRSNLL